MNYESLIKKIKQFQLFGNEVANLFPDDRKTLPLQLHRWARAGKIIRLKRGLYTLPEERRSARFSLLWLANTLYSPSYLSMEFALSWHDMIPERVSVMTSVTRLKTKIFQNPLGRFAYQHLKEDLFFGFETMRDENKAQVLIARPEKALLDWLYLKRDWEPTRDNFEKNLRLQQLDQLNKRLFKSLLKRYSSKKMKQAGEIILEMIS